MAKVLRYYPADPNWKRWTYADIAEGTTPTDPPPPDPNPDPVTPTVEATV